MTIPEINTALETITKLQRRLIEAACQPERSKRAEMIEGADVLFEALALAMGRDVKELDHA